MAFKSVREILTAFKGYEIPKDKRKHFKAEISTLRAQEAKHGELKYNNQTYASIGNLRKLLRLCMEQKKS